MKEKGLLFSTDMVRAILDKRKTQTRRLINVPSDYKFAGWQTDSTFKNVCDGCAIFVPEYDDIKNHTHAIYKRPPYEIGDRIYVRETWQETYNKKSCSWEPVYYADHGNKILIGDDETMTWKPSLHMPKKYARIWLEVTDVRVQQVKDITEEEALKEGFDNFKSFMDYMQNKYGKNIENRWCWVIDFKVIK